MLWEKDRLPEELRQADSGGIPQNRILRISDKGERQEL